MQVQVTYARVECESNSDVMLVEMMLKQYNEQHQPENHIEWTVVNEGPGGDYIELMCSGDSDLRSFLNEL